MANDQRSTTTGRPSRNPKNLTAETRVVRKNWNCALIVTSFIAIHETHFIGRRLRPPVEKKIPATKDMGIWPRLGAFNEAKALQTPSFAALLPSYLCPGGNGKQTLSPTETDPQSDVISQAGPKCFHPHLP